MTASAESRPAPARASSDDSIFGRMKTSVGRWFGGDDEKPMPSPPPKTGKRPRPPPRPAPTHPPRAATAQNQHPPRQQKPGENPQGAPTPARQSAASGASLMNGATPTVPSGGFDNRWGAIR